MSADGLGKQTGQHGGQKPRERLLYRYSAFRRPGQRWKATTETHGSALFATSGEAWTWLQSHTCDQPVRSVIHDDTCLTCGGVLSRHEVTT